MTTPLPCPSASTGSGESFVASSGKLLASHQRQVQRARLLAVVDQSRASINKSSEYDPMTLATPSAGKMSSITGLSFIPKMPPMVEQLLGGAHAPGGGGGWKKVKKISFKFGFMLKPNWIPLNKKMKLNKK